MRGTRRVWWGWLLLGSLVAVMGTSGWQVMGSGVSGGMREAGEVGGGVVVEAEAHWEGRTHGMQRAWVRRCRRGWVATGRVPGAMERSGGDTMVGSCAVKVQSACMPLRI